MEEQKEARRRSRINALFSVLLESEEHSFTLQCHDLSLNGLMLSGKHQCELNQQWQIKIRLSMGEEAVFLESQGRVVRSGDGFVALKFIEISPESYMHLFRLITLNANNPDMIEDEITAPAF